jgi:hypothetical protein
METFSRDFKKAFLFTLTRELIRNSIKDDIIKLQKIFELEEKEEPIIEVEEKQEPIIKIEEEEPIIRVEEPLLEQSILSPEKIEEMEQHPIQIKQIAKRFVTKPVPKKIIRVETKTHLFIPELKLPPHLEYLKPIPKPGIDIDLFKLNPLIKDPAIRLIEVNPDEKVTVMGTMGTKPTDISLSKEDIDRVINKFSEVSKIPTNEGIYRVVAGNLIFSAIISGVIGSKFVIKKMVYPNPSTMQRYPPFFPKRYSLEKDLTL